MFVPKKNGELKMCVDFRRINAVTVKDKYPFPLMADMKTRLRDARYFTILDLRNAFNFIRVKKRNEWKTAFRTKYGTYEYLIMPFGLINAPTTMQKVVNKALQSYLDKFAITYMDDILVYSDIYDQHIKHVRIVLDALKQRNLKIKAEKCKFHVKKVTFLGFVITPKNIQMETTKVNSIQTWPAPKNIKDLQKLLGFIRFYQNMIPKYTEWTSSMTDFLQKDKKFEWGPDQALGLAKLKKHFATNKPLAMHDPKKQTELQTDVSDKTIGAMVFQQRIFLDYYSRKLTPAEANYTTGDKEMLAVVVTLKHWRHLTQRAKHKMFVHTDHKKLMLFLETKQLNPRQVRWLKELACYDFAIKHIKNENNIGADVLSRRPDYKNPNKLIKPKLVKNGDYMQVAEATEKNNDIIRDAHDTRLAGHQGIFKTLKRIQEKTTWKSIKADVKKYIKNCPTCAIGKHDRSRKEKLHQLLKPPEVPFQRPALNFVTGLPESQNPTTGMNYDMICTIVDGLTKYAKFVPYKTTMTAEKLAKLFLKKIFADHGIPEQIISDRNKLFTSKFNTGLRKTLGMKEGMSTTFHPQTDGQIKRMNQTLEQYFRLYTGEKKHKWVKLLPTAQMAINKSYNEDLQQSPYETLYGITLRTIEIGPTVNQAASTFATKMKNNWEAIGNRITKARQKVKKRLNTKRNPVTIKPGDKALLFTKNLTDDKLNTPYIGAFKMVNVKNITVELSLPDTKIFPKFHASLIKKTLPDTPLATIWDYSTKEEYEIERILQERQGDQGAEFLIKWKNYDMSEATWEPKAHLKNAQTALKQFRKAI